MSYEDVKLFPISYTKIAKFETCPFQWLESYVNKNIKFIPNEKTEWGKAVHDAFDKRFKIKVPMSGRFESYEQYAKTLENLPGKLISEYEIVIDEEGKRVGWWDESAYMRAKVDVCILQDTKAVVFDHKTGGRRNSEELEFFVVIMFFLHPEVDDIKTIYAWYKEPGCPLDVEYFNRVNDFGRLLDKFNGKIAKIQEALEFDKFPKKKSGLCKDYCGSTTCVHSGSFVKFPPVGPV